jgi:hypothetical protein
MCQRTEPLALGRSRSERINGKAHYALWLFAPPGMTSEVSNRCAHYALWLFAPPGMTSEVSNRYAHYALWLFVLAGTPVVGHRSTPRWLELTVLDIRSPA